MLNGNSLFSATITGFGATQNFSTTAAFQIGDVIDFAVSASGSPNNDSTGFFASLVTIPEPATVALFGLGLAVLAGLRRRRLA